MPARFVALLAPPRGVSLDPAARRGHLSADACLHAPRGVGKRGRTPRERTIPTPTSGETTRDAILGGRVLLQQPRSGYRAAIDPVLLAASVEARAGESVLDLGCGTGAAALCLAARLPGVSVVGLEMDPETAALAGAGAAASGLAERVAVLIGDVMDPPAPLRGRTFAWVMTNPPYLDSSRVRPSPEPGRRRARVEATGLDAWIGACLRRLAPGGRLVLVHRADRLDALLAALSGAAGSIEVLPLWPMSGRPASRILVRARKGARGACRLLPGLVLHHPDGTYTEAAEAVLRGGRALAW